AAGLGWCWLFVVNPILFAAVGGICLALLKDSGGSPSAAHLPPAAKARAQLVTIIPGAVSLSIGQLFRKPAFLSALLLFFLLTFIRSGFLTWMPTFLAEAAGPDYVIAAVGIIKSAAFPAAGIVGALVAGRASDFFGPGRRGPVIVFC